MFRERERANVRDAKNSNMKFLVIFFALTPSANQPTQTIMESQTTKATQADRRTGVQARAGSWSNGQPRRASTTSATYAFNLYEAIKKEKNMFRSDSQLYFSKSNKNFAEGGTAHTPLTHTHTYGKYEVKGASSAELMDRRFACGRSNK